MVLRVLLCFFILGTIHAQECSERTILVNILNSKDDRVAGIEASDLRVRIGKVPVEVLQVTELKKAPRVLILLDSSGGMSSSVSEHLSPYPNVYSTVRVGASSRNVALPALLHGFLQQMPSDTQFSVAAFHEESHAVSPFTSDQNGFASKLEAQLGNQDEHSRRIAVANAITASLDEFGEIQPGDSVLVISDGVNEHSSDVAAAMKHIERSGVRVHSFLFEPPSVFKRPEEQSFVLRRIVEHTGGSIIEVPRTLDLKQPGVERSIRMAAEQMAERIAFPKELTLRLSNSMPKEGKLKIDSAGRMGLHFEYPKILQSCASPTQTVSR
jgi:hypothetical protein